MGHWRQTLHQDIQYALRTARKSPGFVLAATGTLALGIGATTAIFSILSGVLLRPLPFLHPGRLVQLSQMDARNGIGPVYFADMEDWRKQTRTFAEIAAYANTSKSLLDVPDPERIQAVWAERSLFRLLGVAPLRGRTFTATDPPDLVVLSASLWKRRFASDPSCIGRKITLDREPYTIIGVMPESFQFPYRASLTEMWLPWSMPPQRALNRNSRVDFAVGLLNPGVTLDTARQDLTVLAGQLAAQYPATNRGRAVRITPLAEFVSGSVRGALLTLLGAVALLLLIACANVANLLLARAARRTHEIAVRTALGASRGRIVQQHLTESVLLSLAGGVGGLFLAIGGARLILKFASTQIPRAWEVGIDWRVFCFLLGTSAAAGIAFGILPALTASRTDPQSALKRAGSNRSPGSSRMRDVLVVAEIALSFVLLASAGLLMRGFLRLQETPTGFVPDNVLTLRLTASLQDYRAPGAYGRYLQQLEERVKGTPGVRAAGFIQYLPLQNWGWNAFFSIAGRPQPPGEPGLQAELRYVSPGYFEALRIPLRKGRLFTDRDTPAVPVVIVINQALARRYFPNQDPVGQRTDRGSIIGVVGDVRTSRLDLPATPEIYYAFAQNPAATSDAGVSLVVRTQSPPETLVNAVRDAIHQTNPQQVVYDVKTMEGVIANSLADTRLYLWLIAWFAGLALLLAASGVYGVISYLVTARTQEFGIRIALGAGDGQILRSVLRQGLLLVSSGLILGTAGTLAVARVLQSLLSGVNAKDPPMLLLTSALLAGVALAACLSPARRATQVDPLVALKYE